MAAAETRAVAAETQARAAQEDRMRAYVTASELRVETLDSWRLMLPRQPRPLRLRAPPRLNGAASRTSSSCRLGRISRIPTI